MSRHPLYLYKDDSLKIINFNFLDMQICHLSV
jgi:hypothetical protein